MENLIKEYKYQDFTASFDNTFQGGNETAVEYTYNDIAALDTDFSEQDDYEADAEETEIIRDSSLEISEEEAKHIIKDAEAQAASIIKEAMDTAERVKKDAFVEAGAAASEAQTTGYNEG